MNKQEIFNKVRDHLLSQNARSAVYGRNLYRGPDGLMCAIGCLVEDSHYTPEMERYTPDGLHVMDALIKSGIPEEVIHSGLLYDLQLLHDTLDPEDWSLELRWIARDHGLSHCR